MTSDSVSSLSFPTEKLSLHQPFEQVLWSFSGTSFPRLFPIASLPSLFPRARLPQGAVVRADGRVVRGTGKFIRADIGQLTSVLLSFAWNWRRLVAG